MFRRVMSWVGRIALGILTFGLAVLLVTVPVGVLGSSNLVWGEDNQYGRVDVPGTAVLRLPAGSVQVSVAVDLVGRGNGTPDLPLPSDLALVVTAVDGAGQPVVTRVHGAGSSNANDDRVNTQIEAWTVDVPRAGSYRVTTKGDFDGIGINPQLWFGHGPPIPGTMVPVVAAGIVVVLGVIWLLLMPVVRRRRQASPPRESRAATRTRVAADPLDRLSKLADLRERGVLTDAEFDAEKAKILRE